MMHWLVPGLALLFSMSLWHMWRRQQLKLMRGRAGLLQQASAMLGHPIMGVDAMGYAGVQGSYEAYQLRLGFEPEQHTLRKLPNLWLHISIKRKQAGLNTLDILVRPQNTETYSPYWGWDKRVQPLPGWPTHALYRSRRQAPSLASIDDAVQTLFSDPHSKELLLTEQSLRITYLAKQAERGDYLLLRAANFDHTPLPGPLLQNLLQQAVKLAALLEENLESSLKEDPENEPVPTSREAA